MTSFSLDYRQGQRDPDATLTILRNAVDQVYLSVAYRAGRNRTNLYQAKHVRERLGLATQERDPMLAALNFPISEHFRLLREQLGSEGCLDDRRLLAFPISDLTANPLRPHWDASASPESAFPYAVTNKRPYRDSLDARLFFLDGEPILQVPYSILICYERGQQTGFTIQHDVKLRADGSLPDEIPQEIREGLKYWMACPPLLIEGDHKPDCFAVLDYDLRHIFGLPCHFKQFGFASQSDHEEALYRMYEKFPEWKSWEKTVREELSKLETTEICYHAALGLASEDLIVVHRATTIPDLAAQLKQLGATEAVLLDTGGSCAVWANWLNDNQGGVLASSWNFRPRRGAVLFVLLSGKRGIPQRRRPKTMMEPPTPESPEGQQIGWATDRDLVQAFSKGNSSAVEEIHRRFEKLIRSISWRFAKPNFADAEDVAQEIWLHLLVQLVKWDPSEGSLGGFVARVARNKACDWYRRKGRRLRTDSIDELIALGREPADSRDDSNRREIRIAVRDCVDRLSVVNHRRALELWMLDYPSETIAEILGSKRSTVDSWIYRAKRQVWSCLENSDAT